MLQRPESYKSVKDSPSYVLSNVKNMRQLIPEAPRVLLMQRSFTIKVREGHPVSYLSLISDETKKDFESDLNLIFMVKICLR